jgi:hypothetical protein
MGCGLGENQPDDVREFCDSGLYSLPLLGVAYTLGGGVLAAVRGSLPVLALGTGVGAAFGLAVWVDTDTAAMDLMLILGLIAGGAALVWLGLSAALDRTR